MTNDALSGLLFGQDRTLVNLKLCRGDAPQVGKADLRDEVHFALTQVLLGKSEVFDDFPEDRDAKRVNIAALA